MLLRNVIKSRFCLYYKPESKLQISRLKSDPFVEEKGQKRISNALMNFVDADDDGAMLFGNRKSREKIMLLELKCY